MRPASPASAVLVLTLFAVGAAACDRAAFSFASSISHNHARRLLCPRPTPICRHKRALCQLRIQEAAGGEPFAVRRLSIGQRHHPESKTCCEPRNKSTKGLNNKWNINSVVTVMSIICWLVSMLSYASPVFVRSGWMHRLRFAALPSIALGLPTIASKARRAIVVRRRVDASCMMFAASLGAIILGDYTEAAAVTSLYAVSEVLEERASDSSAEALSNVAKDLGPGRARLLLSSTMDGSNGVSRGGGSEKGEQDEITIVPADQISVGSSVSVPVGEKVPCDCIVISGTTSMDESAITGESRPSPHMPGDALPAGGVNAGPESIVVRTTAMASDSAVARLAKLVEESKLRKSPTERMVDELAGRYAPIVFLAAISMATIPWALFGSGIGRRWTRRGLVTMVAACPCPLVISTPVTYVGGLAATAREGVIVKGGAILEALGRVKKIAFDKTGTLTEGKFALRNLNITDDCLGRKEVIEYLALMEAPSAHPLASALVQAAREEGINAPKHIAVRNHTILNGEGVVASIEGKSVHVGNTRLFKRIGLYDKLLQRDKEQAKNWARAGETVGFMSIEDADIVCMYSVADGIRPEAKSVIRQLQDMGIEVIMLTGDGRDAAIAVGDRVGLLPNSIHSQLHPEDKLGIISAAKEEVRQGRTRGNVLMCGDGVNDAPALALADIGVAMGTGAALATETSDVVLTDSNLNKLLGSIRIGRHAIRTIVQNFSICLAAKGLVVVLATFGITSLWAAIASDVGTMLLVTTNSLRILSSRQGLKLSRKKKQQSQH